MLAIGERAPDVFLKPLDGELPEFQLRLPAAPTVLTFFTVDCPTCRLALPFLDRIARGDGLRICGVSQDSAEETAGSSRQLGLRHLETLLDEPPHLASRAFQVSIVPSLFVIERNQTISKAAQGFLKADFEELGNRAGVQVFTETDRVPLLRPG